MTLLLLLIGCAVTPDPVFDAQGCVEAACDDGADNDQDAAADCADADCAAAFGTWTRNSVDSTVPILPP